ncbi:MULTISPECIES: hypothetical protein [unclassified Lysobacter]|uniref:hypothetical protein n=1 Tax=unclassified Lysobacter TaxID=2635362 RepID=UPI00070DBFDA|nr:MULTISPECIES: hypothetical protein [unclassified Lysobacter]KRD34894.1 hypothetical protein ASE35_09200 [Lysobacter sp. Root916]KRD77264.1 hypothetical protein ASE43_08890 [Lysobacter sp. Root983]
MPWTRDRLDAELAALETQLPAVEHDVDRHDVLARFAVLANPILEAAAADDYAHALDRIQAMLAARGLVLEDDGVAG